MTRTIAIFLGRFNSFNVQQTVKNVGKMLADVFDLHLVTTDPETFQDYDQFGFSVYAPTTGQGRLQEVRALKRYLCANDPDVLTQVGDVPIYGNLISLLRKDSTDFICRYSGDLFTEYTLETGVQKAKLYILKNGLGRLPLRYADRIIAMGPRGKRRIVNRGVSPQEVKILPPPIDLDRFKEMSVPTELETDPDDPIALFVGRVSRLKGAATLEETIPEIADRRPNLNFVFVGTEQYEFDLPERYRDQIELVGSVPPTSIPAYFDIADVYIHPSLTEGISRSVLEAMACKTPVVVRDVGDLAYATSNLFTTDDDFVDMVVEFESLTLDSPQKFTVETLTSKYRSVYGNI